MEQLINGIRAILNKIIYKYLTEKLVNKIYDTAPLLEYFKKIAKQHIIFHYK